MKRSRQDNDSIGNKRPRVEEEKEEYPEDRILAEREDLGVFFPEVMIHIIQEYTKHSVLFGATIDRFINQGDEEAIIKNVLLCGLQTDILPYKWARELIRFHIEHTYGWKRYVDYEKKLAVNQKDWDKACQESECIRVVDLYFKEYNEPRQALLREILRQRIDDIETHNKVSCKCCHATHLFDDDQEQVKQMQSMIDSKERMDLNSVRTFFIKPSDVQRDAMTWSDQISALECLMEEGIPFHEAYMAMNNCKNVVHVLLAHGKVFIKREDGKIQVHLPEKLKGMATAYKVNLQKECLDLVRK